MKRIVLMLLVICIVAGTLLSCRRSDTLTLATTGGTSIENVTISETTIEEMTAEMSTAEETTAEEPTETTTLKPVPEEWEGWRKKADALLQSVEAPGFANWVRYELTDMTGDGIPEIIEHYSEYEVGGISAIWTWYNGEYVLAYRLIPVYERTGSEGEETEEEYRPQYFQAFRNKQTGQTEFWEIGDLDYTLEDFFEVNEYGERQLWPMVGEVAEQIVRVGFVQGKLHIAEKHDELKNFLRYDMTETEAQTAWQALRDFREAFWSTHEREPVDVHHTEIEFSIPDYSAYLVIDRNALRSIVEKY